MIPRRGIGDLFSKEIHGLPRPHVVTLIRS